MVGRIRQDHPTMGCRDMYYKLMPDFIGRDAFELICKESGLYSKKNRNMRRTTDSSGVKRFENLTENVKADRLNKIWTSDITYYELNGRFYYITFIIDACSSRIVGHSTSKNLGTEQTTLPALKMAIKTRAHEDLTGLIFHSDGGGQYYDKEFLKLTAKNKIRNSMCIYPWENGNAERMNGVIKNNYLKYKRIYNYEDLIREVDHAVQMYNYEKPHIRLKRQTPIKYENKMILLQQQTS
jgi:putative transposase